MARLFVETGTGVTVDFNSSTIFRDDRDIFTTFTAGDDVVFLGSGRVEVVGSSPGIDIGEMIFDTGITAIDILTNDTLYVRDGEFDTQSLAVDASMNVAASMVLDDTVSGAHFTVHVSQFLSLFGGYEFVNSGFTGPAVFDINGALYFDTGDNITSNLFEDDSLLRFGGTHNDIRILIDSSDTGTLSSGAHVLITGSVSSASGVALIDAMNNSSSQFTVSDTAFVTGDVNFGDGTTTVTIRGSYEGDVDLGNGVNTYRQDGNFAETIGDLNGGDDADDIRLEDGSFQGDISTRGGNDSVLLDFNLLFTGDVDTGAGDDAFTMGGYVLGDVDLGNGNNQVSLGLGSFLNGFLTTGDDDDTIDLDGFVVGVESGGGDDDIDASGVTTSAVIGINFNAGDGDDTVAASFLNDTINAGTGTNTVTGGGGIDTFIFNEAGSVTTLTDFQIFMEEIRILGLTDGSTQFQYYAENRKGDMELVDVANFGRANASTQIVKICAAQEAAGVRIDIGCTPGFTMTELEDPDISILLSGEVLSRLDFDAFVFA